MFNNGGIFDLCFREYIGKKKNIFSSNILFYWKFYINIRIIFLVSFNFVNIVYRRES